MKKLLRSFLTVGLTVFFLFPVYATHYMGGEITWECLPNGNYRFILKAYRECYTTNGSSAVNYGQTQTLYSNSPAGSITLSRLSGWPKDISPVCNNNTNFPHIVCTGDSAGQANMGAVEEHIFTSDANYPNGVSLQGVPVSTGWMFYWGSCCRNPATNIVNANSMSWRLRAIMYPYGNQNMYPCYDNSPVFAEKPRTVVPTGPISFNNLAFDRDHDSLSYEWGQPLLSNGQPITSYASGYSYTNPLPGTAQNSNNIPAIIDPVFGQVKLTSYTTGAFVTSIKVTSWRQGQKISEIWRDIQVVITAGNLLNNAPNITLPFNNGTSDSLTVKVGDTVAFNLSATDFQFLPDGTPQTIFMNYFGEEFGEFVPGSSGISSTLSATTGCSRPPCATLTPAPGPSQPLQAPFGVQTQFSWVTSCNHLKDAEGNYVPLKTYYFLFSTRDDDCPVPAVSYRIIKLTIKDLEPVQSPDIESVTFDYSNYYAHLLWSQANDSLGQFVGYYIYYSQFANGPFTLGDSIMNINTIHDSIYLGPVNTAYFYIKVKSMTSCPGSYYETTSPVYPLILTGMEDVVRRDGFSDLRIHPNPASQTAEVDFVMAREAPVEYSLYSPDGRLIEQRQMQARAGTNHLTIDIAGLPNGIYYYSLTAFGLKKSARLVVIKK